MKAHGIAPCACLASSSASAHIVSSIIPSWLCGRSFPNLDDAEPLWAIGYNQLLPAILWRMHLILELVANYLPMQQTKHLKEYDG